jgi:hypothetical protein
MLQTKSLNSKLKLILVLSQDFGQISGIYRLSKLLQFCFYIIISLFRNSLFSHLFLPGDSKEEEAKILTVQKTFQETVCLQTQLRKRVLVQKDLVRG